MYIGNFLSIKSPYEIHQNQCLSWLSTAHHLAQKSQHHTQEEYLKMLLRVGCSEQQIERRFFFVPDVTHLDFDNNEIYPVKTSTRGVSMHHRHEFYHKTVRELFHRIYEERSFPDDLIHVSCTGYISPSAAQMEAMRSPHPVTVTHSYHMGCYGAFPALRMASSFLTNENILGKKRSVDLVRVKLLIVTYFGPLNIKPIFFKYFVLRGIFLNLVGCLWISIFKRDTPSWLDQLS